MQSVMALAGIAGGIYLEADRYRRARVAGVEVAPSRPLDPVLNQSGLHIPTLEALLARMMGDTAEAKKAAAAIISNSRDPGALLQQFAAHFNGAKEDESKAAEGAGAASPSGPGAEQASTSAPPTSAAPPNSTSPANAAQVPSATPPSPSGAPGANPGPVFHPPHAYRSQPAQPQGRTGLPPLFRPDYAAEPAPGQYPQQPPLFRPDYAQEASPTGGWSTHRPFGAPHSPFAQAPTRPRVPPPPVFRSQPNPRTAAKSAPAGPTQRPPRRAPGSTMPTRQTSPTAGPSPKADAARRETNTPSEGDASLTFLDWMKDRLATIERQREADLAELRRAVADDLHRLERVEAIIGRLEAAERDSATTPSNANPSTSTAGAAVQTAAEPADAATTVSEVTAPEAPVQHPEPTADDRPSIDADNRPSIEAETESAGDDADPTAEPVEGSQDNATSPASDAVSASPSTTTASKPASSPSRLDEPVDDGPPLPSPEEMVEATRLLVLHEERMRELDAEAHQERDGYIRRLIRVEDQCTALALVRDHQIP